MADTDKLYISKVTLPSGNTYDIKDAEAREAIEKLSNAMHFLGVTTTVLTDGATTNPITINDESVTAVAGDVVIYKENRGTDLDPEYVPLEFVYDEDGVWQLLGEESFDNLGDLAFKDEVSGITDPATLSATEIPVVLGSASVSGATAITTITSTSDVTVITGASYKEITGVTYDKATGGAVTVNSSATFAGVIPSNTVITNVTGGTGVSNAAAVPVTFTSTADSTATTLVYGVGSEAPVTGNVTVTGVSVYGVTDSSASYMTGPESIDYSNLESAVTSVTLASASAGASGSVILASVDSSETLHLFALAYNAPTAQVLGSNTTLTTGASATPSAYDVGASGTISLNSGAKADITVNTSNYKAEIPVGSVITSVNAINLTSAAVDISVSGSAVTDSAVSITTYDSSAAAAVGSTTTAVDTTGKTVDIKAPITVASSYATVSAYAGGDHTHDFTGA